MDKTIRKITNPKQQQAETYRFGRASRLETALPPFGRPVSAVYRALADIARNSRSNTSAFSLSITLSTAKDLPTSRQVRRHLCGNQDLDFVA